MAHEEAIIMLHGLRMDYICSACEEHNNPKLKNFPRDCPLYSNCNKVHDECGGFLIKNYPCKCGQMVGWSDTDE